MSGPDFTADQHAVYEDFKVSIGKVFQSLYDEKWDEDLWNTTICMTLHLSRHDVISDARSLSRL